METLFHIAGLPKPILEHPFAEHLGRRWRFDWAWPDRLLAVEYEGATYSGGRHVRGKGYGDDCEKYSVAAALGWRVLRFTADMVRDGRALKILEMAAEDNHA